MGLRTDVVPWSGVSRIALHDVTRLNGTQSSSRELGLGGIQPALTRTLPVNAAATAVGLDRDQPSSCRLPAPFNRCAAPRRQRYLTSDSRGAETDDEHGRLRQETAAIHAFTHGHSG